MPPTESAVIVAVPEAEPAVAALRARLDRAAGWGVPAHVTLLYPFVPPDRIDDATVDALRRVIHTVPAFDVTFRAVRWFGAEVVYLAPEPDRPFRALTDAIAARFPDHPPYAGTIQDPTPHLTVAHDHDRDTMQNAADAVRTHLPLRAHITHARLIQGSLEPGSWHTRAELPLA